MGNKARVVLVVMSVVIGIMLVITGLLIINYPRSGHVSEFSYMEECSTGVLLGIGGFILAATGLNNWIKTS
jgi:hypothetical protein